MKTLIINADDMGVSQIVNNAVIDLYNAGAITGTSLIAPGPAFPEACCSMRDNGIKEAGVHLTLTGKFRPVSGESRNGKGFFAGLDFFPPDYLSLAAALYSGKIKKEDLKIELRSQVKKIKDTGLTITHLDGHEHVHMLPRVLDVALELCDEFSIQFLRMPLEDPSILRVSFSLKDFIRYRALRFFASKACYKISKTSVCRNDAFLGHFHSGRLNREILSFMAEHITNGITELAVHPALFSYELDKNLSWYKNGHVELSELKSKNWKDKLKDNGITLIPHSAVSF